jgi:hypothetical protein
MTLSDVAAVLSSSKKSMAGLSLSRDYVERMAWSNGTLGSCYSGEERMAREGGERDRALGSNGEARLEPGSPPPDTPGEEETLATSNSFIIYIY